MKTSQSDIFALPCGESHGGNIAGLVGNCTIQKSEHPWLFMRQGTPFDWETRLSPTSRFHLFAKQLICLLELQCKWRKRCKRLDCSMCEPDEEGSNIRQQESKCLTQCDDLAPVFRITVASTITSSLLVVYLHPLQRPSLHSFTCTIASIDNVE